MPQEMSFDERYAKGEIPWDSGRPSGELIRILNSGKLTGKTVLEIGCGTGTNAIELARRGFKVTAVDYVEQPIQAVELFDAVDLLRIAIEHVTRGSGSGRS